MSINPLKPGIEYTIIPPSTLDVEGCTDASACNYNPAANIDDGTCTDYLDCTGTCDGDTVDDCWGDCGGTAFEDICGECVEGNTGDGAN